MNAYTAIARSIDPCRPHFPDDLSEVAEARNRLIAARDLALAVVGQSADGWVRDLNRVMYEVANQMAFADAPATAIHDGLALVKALQRAQAMAGTLDGTYPTDRYNDNKRERDD